MNCPDCNKKIPDNAKFCGFCGNKLESPKEKDVPKGTAHDETNPEEENDSTTKLSSKSKENLTNASEELTVKLPSNQQEKKIKLSESKQNTFDELKFIEKKTKPTIEKESIVSEFYEGKNKNTKPNKTVDVEKTKSNNGPPNKTKSENKSTTILISVTLGVLMAIAVIVLITIDFGKPEEKLTSTYPSDQETWTKTIHYNTIEAYQQYIKMFPQGKNVFDANIKIKQIQKNNIPSQSTQTVETKHDKEPDIKEITKYESATVKQKKVNVNPSTKSNNNSTITSSQINKQKNTTKAEPVIKSGTTPEPVEEPKPTYTSITSGKKTNETEDNTIYEVVDKTAVFPGGLNAMMRFIAKNIKYPMKATEKNIEGRVFISLIVEKNGKLDNIRVIRGIGGGCDEEAIRVIKKMPDWEPARLNNKKVRLKYTIPIVFKLKKL